MRSRFWLFHRRPKLIFHLKDEVERLSWYYVDDGFSGISNVLSLPTKGPWVAQVNNQKRIFIVDDHELVRTLLKEYLDMEADLEVCGSVDSGKEALERLLQAPQTADEISSSPALECDLALIDISIPDLNGIELVRRLREERPSLRCLILSGHAKAVYAEDALRAGARGYVMKGDPDMLVEAIRQVLRGETYVDEQIEGK